MISVSADTLKNLKAYRPDILKWPGENTGSVARRTPRSGVWTSGGEVKTQVQVCDSQPSAKVV